MIRALLENFTALMTCISTRNHLFICGKPGSSKTLTVSLAKEVLSKDYNDKPLLKHFIKARFDDFWGSFSTTSNGLKQKIDSVKAKALNDFSSNEVFTLIMDEIGLAEMSPDNPLKVLPSALDSGSEDDHHELLELFKINYPNANLDHLTAGLSDQNLGKKLKEIEKKKFCFIGISNTKQPDASNSNRMTIVARPSLGEEDFVDTSKRLFENTCRGMIQEVSEKYRRYLEHAVDDMATILAKCTVEFNRESRQNCNLTERGMHGSRDNFYLNKYFFQTLRDIYLEAKSKPRNMKIEPEENPHQVKIENLERKMVQTVIAGIARNYSGGEDSYRKFMALLKKNLKDYKSDSKIDWSEYHTEVEENS